MLPTEDDAFFVDDDEAAGNKTGATELSLGNLAFAFESGEAGAPGNRARGDVFVPGDFDGFNLLAAFFYADDFIEMTGIKPDPLAG